MSDQEIHRGPADVPIAGAPQLPYGVAKKAQGILDSIAPQPVPGASSPQPQTPAPEQMGPSGQSGSAPPEAPFKPTGDLDSFKFGPSARPGESVFAGFGAQGTPFPDDLKPLLPFLTRLASEPGASPRVQRMVISLVNRAMAAQ